MSFKTQFSHTQIFFALAVFISLSFIFQVIKTNAQNRDHLTNKEIEIVRDVQSIDYRMLVFIKAIERRFMALEGTDNLTERQLKRNKKDLENWGELPNGTNAQLFSDIDKIINESISKIEDVAERERKSKLLPIALHVLADRAKLFIPKLEAYAKKTDNRREIALLNSAIDNCKDIIKATTKVKRPEEKQLKKLTKKID